MQRSCILVVALVLCGTAEAQRIEIGTYVMSQGVTEVTREHYRFDGTTLADTVEFPSRGVRMESIASYDGTYTPASYALDLYRGTGPAPVQRVNVAFDDTAAVWSTQTELGDSDGVTPLEGSYAFMQNLVFAHLAVVLLKYDHEQGGVQDLSVWMPEQAATFDMDIEFTSRTAGTVAVAGTVMNVEVDESGWLRRASVPAQNVTVESVDRTPPGE